MPLRGQPYVHVFYVRRVDETPVTGHAGNITVYVSKNGGAPYAVAAPVEISSSLMPGWYRVQLNATDMDADTVLIAPRSNQPFILCDQHVLYTEQGRLTQVHNTLNSVSDNVNSVKTRTDQLQFSGGNVFAEVRGYASGMSPASQVLFYPGNRIAADSQGRVIVGGYAPGLSPSDLVLLNGNNRIATDSAGRVTVGANADKSGYSLSTSNMDALVDLVWNEVRGTRPAGSFGHMLDVAVSTRMPSGNVVVGGYASGQSPAEQVLQNPTQRLSTDSSGRVQVSVNHDKSGYSLTSAERSSIAASVWTHTTRTLTSFGTLVSDIVNALMNNVVEASFTFRAWLRMVGAVLFGKRTVAGGNFVYYGMDETTVRVAGTIDDNKNRNVTTRDG